MPDVRTYSTVKKEYEQAAYEAKCAYLLVDRSYTDKLAKAKSLLKELKMIEDSFSHRNTNIQ